MNEKFMQLGVLLDPKVAELLAQRPELEETMFNKIQQLELRPIVLTEQIFKKLQIPEPRIIKSKIQKEEWSIQDIIDKYNARYSELQKILANKATNIISINRAASAYGEASIIGMVKGKEESALELEDTTGTIKVFLKDKEKMEKIEIDDVIAVSGILKDKALYNGAVTWPDVLIKEVKKSSGEVIFISDFTFNKLPEQVKEADYIILVNCSGIERLAGLQAHIITTQKLHSTINITNPSLIDIAGMVVLVYFGELNPADIIRKRYIDDFIITPEPDIIFAPNSGKIENYKGTTIISGNAEVDLETREAKTIALDTVE